MGFTRKFVREAAHNRTILGPLLEVVVVHPQVQCLGRLGEDRMINPAAGFWPICGPLGPENPWDGRRLEK